MTEVINHTLEGERMVESGGSTEIHASHHVELSNSVPDIIPVLETSGIPGLGASHPSYAGAYCVSRVARAIDPMQFRVSTVWRIEADEIPGGVLSLGSGISSRRDTVDFDGNPIYTTYFYENTDENFVLQGGIRRVYHEVDFKVPLGILRFTRVDNDFNRAFVDVFTVNGHINSDEWRGIPPGFFLCTRADLEVVNHAIGKYREVYEFAFKPDGWGTTVSHKRSDTKDAVDTSNTAGPNGQSGETTPRKKIQVYQSADFNRLNLTG